MMKNIAIMAVVALVMCILYDMALKGVIGKMLPKKAPATT